MHQPESADSTRELEQPRQPNADTATLLTNSSNKSTQTTTATPSATMLHGQQLAQQPVTTGSGAATESTEEPSGNQQGWKFYSWLYVW